MKILLLSDNQGWIVDRISRVYQKLIPEDIEIDYYTNIEPGRLSERAKTFDLVHFNNTDITKLMGEFKEIDIPIMASVRSFRYPSAFRRNQKELDLIHVIHPDLKKRFDNAIYVPDGIFEGFKPGPFIVGLACQEPEWSKEYKGYYLVKQACEELGCIFKPAHNRAPSTMRDYYKSLDLYVSASQREGFGAAVLEAMSLNVPVLTTNTGIAKGLDVVKCERSVESIKQGIKKFYTYPQVKDYTWESACEKLTEVYRSL